MSPWSTHKRNIQWRHTHFQVHTYKHFEGFPTSPICRKTCKCGKKANFWCLNFKERKLIAMGSKLKLFSFKVIPGSRLRLVLELKASVFNWCWMVQSFVNFWNEKKQQWKFVLLFLIKYILHKFYPFKHCNHPSRPDQNRHFDVDHHLLLPVARNNSFQQVISSVGELTKQFGSKHL